MSTPYFVAPDADDEPTLWRHDPDRPDYPQPVVRRFEVGDPVVWDGLAAWAAGGMSAPTPDLPAVTPERLAEIRARVQGATPGPWEAVAGAFGDPANGPDHMRVLREGWTEAYDAEHTVARLEYDARGGSDAEFIAHAREDVPALLAEVERLKRWKAEATSLFDGLQDLGRALGLPLGTLITGPSAVDAARSLRAERDALAARLAAQPAECFGKVWDVDCGEMAARVERVRAYVDHPGNWSGNERRRLVILDLLDGKTVPGLVEVDGGLIQP